MIEELEKLCPVVVRISAEEQSQMYNSVWNYLCEDDTDIMVLLGDRTETLIAAAAAAHFRIPIAHIHGGESTYGAMDDSMRHAISKLSHLHFVANVPFHDVLLQMGERNIWVTGAPGIDNLVPYMEMERKPEKYFVCTYHPETLGDDSQLINLIDALREHRDHAVFWTGVNTDPGSQVVHDTIMAGDVGIIVDWTLDEYLTHCRYAAAVIGNSSSGIIEAPYLEVPTVNIGQRQEGRPMGRSIYQPRGIKGIHETICEALLHDTAGYRYDRLYGEPGASKKIAGIIANQDLTDILRKPWPI